MVGRGSTDEYVNDLGYKEEGIISGTWASPWGINDTGEQRMKVSKGKCRQNTRKHVLR